MIIVLFLIFDRTNWLKLTASIIGVASLIFNAKENWVGQALIIFFSILYDVISYTFAYYGEMITYLGMTMPTAIFSLLSWLKNTYKNNKLEVKINAVSKTEQVVMWIITSVVTLFFYFILEYFNTANMIPSTISVATSFVAGYLTFRRSPYFALAYVANDIVLVVLWFLASITNISYVSVLVCFVVFLFNDIYTFINWLKMKRAQKNNYFLKTIIF